MHATCQDVSVANTCDTNLGVCKCGDNAACDPSSTTPKCKDNTHADAQIEDNSKSPTCQVKHCVKFI